MNRKTLLAGAAFAGLLVIALIVLRAPEKGTRTGTAPRPLPAITAGSIDTLEVTKDGKKTVIKKDGSTYKVTEPVPYAADVDAAKEAFAAVEKLEFGDVITDQKAKHDEFEVGDKSVRVVAKKGAQVLADLRIGKTNNGNTMVRPEGKDEVWQVAGAVRSQLDRDSAGWRNKTITTFDQNDVEGLQVVAKGGGKIVLSKPPKADGGADSGWKIVETNVKAEPFDKAVASDLVSALAGFKTNDFADGVSPAVSGLDTPELTVTVSLRGGKKSGVTIGKKKGDDDFYVKADDNPQVFLVKKYAIDRINKRPNEFREKTICNVADTEVTQIAVNRDKDAFTLVKDPKKSGDAAWKLSKPTGVTLDPAKVNAIASAFKEWKAQGFAAETAPATTGLAKPIATITATSNVKGHGCTLRVGGEVASDKQTSYVSPAGSSDVYTVPKWSLDRVLVKLDDLKKK